MAVGGMLQKRRMLERQMHTLSAHDGMHHLSGIDIPHVQQRLILQKQRYKVLRIGKRGIQKHPSMRRLRRGICTVLRGAQSQIIGGYDERGGIFFEDGGHGQFFQERRGRDEKEEEEECSRCG
jgi:hypothetical protein